MAVELERDIGANQRVRGNLLAESNGQIAFNGETLSRPRNYTVARERGSTKIYPTP